MVLGRAALYDRPTERRFPAAHTTAERCREEAAMSIEQVPASISHAQCSARLGPHLGARASLGHGGAVATAIVARSASEERSR